MKSRREVLKTLAVVPLGLAASRILPDLGANTPPVRPVVLKAGDLLLVDEHEALHHAQAEVREATGLGLVAVAGLMATGLALREVFRRLNVSFHLRQHIDYSVANACEANFRSFERRMRPNGVNQFAGVQRSPHDSGIGILACQDPSVWTAMQYTTGPLVELSGRETRVIEAASRFVERTYRSSGRALARAQAVTNRSTETLEDQRGARYTFERFMNPDGGYLLHYNRPFREFDGGLVGIHRPGHTDEADLPWVGLQTA